MSGTGLQDGTPVTIISQVPGAEPVSTPAAILGGSAALIAGPEAFGVGARSVTVTVVVTDTDIVYGPYDASLLPLPDVCTGEGTISLIRDCAAPDDVLAAVDVTGLTVGTHGVAVIGSTGTQEVVLASADIAVLDGTISGTLPLLSATGTVPLEGFTGIALVVDGTTFASVAGNDVSLGSCVVPTPLPAAPPAPPAPPTSTASQVHPTASQVHPTASPTSTPARPAALAQTGSESGSLLLLAGAFLVLGGLTTLAARRTTR